MKISRPFSHQLFDAIVDLLGGVQIAQTRDVDGDWPVYEVKYKGKRFAFYRETEKKIAGV